MRGEGAHSKGGADRLVIGGVDGGVFTDVTQVVALAVRAVTRMPAAFSMRSLEKLLRGSSDAKAKLNGHDRRKRFTANMDPHHLKPIGSVVVKAWDLLRYDAAPEALKLTEFD